MGYYGTPKPLGYKLQMEHIVHRLRTEYHSCSAAQNICNVMLPYFG